MKVQNRQATLASAEVFWTGLSEHGLAAREGRDLEALKALCAARPHRLHVGDEPLVRPARASTIKAVIADLEYQQAELERHEGHQVEMRRRFQESSRNMQRIAAEVAGDTWKSPEEEKDEALHLFATIDALLASETESEEQRPGVLRLVWSVTRSLSEIGNFEV